MLMMTIIDYKVSVVASFFRVPVTLLLRRSVCMYVRMYALGWLNGFAGSSESRVGEKRYVFITNGK